MNGPLNIRKVRTTQLEAWPVVSSALFDFATASDDIVSIVGFAGLEVDWTLNPKEGYSHSTRKRAYRPRVQAAYSRLPSEDRIAVLTAISAELARRYPGQLENIKLALLRIGWILKTAVEATSGTQEKHMTMKRDKYLQQLILRQVRDGKEPAELANYSQQEQVYNAALLINDGYVDGQAIQDGSGIYVSVVMTELTSRGQDLLEQMEAASQFRPESRSVTESRSSNAPFNGDPTAMPKESKLIFISHSSADKDLAEALVDMLCTALNLRRAAFLCTSVDGAKLQGGDETDIVLRQAIRDVPTFLSILTPAAVRSTYVLFELGARWGAGRPHIPLLAKGAGPEVLKEPLKSKNALKLSHQPDVLQLVGNLGDQLGISPERPESYFGKMLKIVETAGRPAVVPHAVEASTPLARTTAVANDILLQCARVLRGAPTLASGLARIRDLQKSWDPTTQQVSVVVDGRFVLHALAGVENVGVEGCWKDQDSNGDSRYPEMERQRRGCLTARIEGYPNRLTVIAFEHLDNPSCMIVAEAHHIPKE
jgi:hypothetical protein